MANRFKLERVSRDPGRTGLYTYGPATIWISGPGGGTWWATIKFLSQEIDLDARSFEGVLNKAIDWIDDAPEHGSLREAGDSRARFARPSRKSRSAPRPRPRAAKREFHIGQDVQMISNPLYAGHVVGFDPDGSVMVQWHGGRVVTGVSPGNLKGLPPGYAGRRMKAPRRPGTRKVRSKRAASRKGSYVVVWADGGSDDTAETYEVAQDIVLAKYPDAEIGHDGDLADGGDRTLCWATEEDSVDDDGARAVCSIHRAR